MQALPLRCRRQPFVKTDEGEAMGELFLYEKSRAEWAGTGRTKGVTGEQRIGATPNGQDVTYFVPVAREGVEASEHLHTLRA